MVLAHRYFPAVALALLSLATRWVGLSQLGLARGREHTDLYSLALTEHFWEFILFAHTKPPFAYGLQSALIRACDSCYGSPLSLIPIMLLDVVGVVLVYLACIRVGAGRVPSLLIAGVWSVGLVFFEKWQTHG